MGPLWLRAHDMFCLETGRDILKIQNLCAEIIIAQINSRRLGQVSKQYSCILDNVTLRICVDGIGHTLLIRTITAAIIYLLMQSIITLRKSPIKCQIAMSWFNIVSISCNEW